MSNDPAAMLAIFLSIDPKVIARDLQEAKGQLRRVVDTISSLRAVHYKSRTPEIEAKISHFMMIQAHELANMPHVESEFKTFYASFGAGEVVQNAEEAAFNKGKLGEEIKAWVEEHPEIKSKIAERIRNVPEANRERAFINAAKTEAMNQTVRPAGNSVRP